MQDETFVVLAEWLEDQRLNWTDKVLLAKLYKLTKEGTRDFVSPNLSSYLAKMGLTNLRHSWKRIIECGYITKTVDKLHGNMTTVAIVKTTQGYSQNDNSLLSKRHEGYSQNDISSSTKVNYLSSTLVSGTPTLPTPIDKDFCFEMFTNVSNEMLNDPEYQDGIRRLTNLRPISDKYFNTKITYLNKGWWGKGQKITYETLKASIETWLINEVQHMRADTSTQKEIEKKQRQERLMNSPFLNGFVKTDCANNQSSNNNVIEVECDVVEEPTNLIGVSND